MKTVCKLDNCTGCCACVDTCPKSAIKIVDTLSEYNAIIDETKCVKCNQCYSVCQVNKPSNFMTSIKWYQGWSCDEKVRANASSGGGASALAKAFIEHYGMVCSCTFENGQFGFKIVENIKELDKFTGSKYVKSNPVGIYKEIKKYLDLDKKVLFIGMPCQVAAVKNYLGLKYEDNLYTIDLICHGTPSPKILNRYLEENGYDIQEIKNIQFRKKTKFHLYVDGKPVVGERIFDPYLKAFLETICYTENCYQCGYAQRKRVSDITLGDAWGSELAEREQEKGISLFLCQSKKGIQLLEQSNIYLEHIDLQKAVDANVQLKEASKKTKKNTEFFSQMKKGKSFKRVMMRCYPKEYCKNLIKKMMIKLHIL